MKRYGMLLMALLLAALVLAGCGSAEAPDHKGEAKTPSASSVWKGDPYEDVVAAFEESGFTNIRTEKLEDLITGWLTKDGAVESVSVGGDTEYAPDVWVPADTEVVITYHAFPEKDQADDAKESEPPASDDADSQQASDSEADEKAFSYSSNGKDTVRNGNAGQYAYKSRGGSYATYYIVDFDEGYVYSFTDGNGNDVCERIKIESGDLNDVLIITYHDGNDVWSNGLHFKWKDRPDHLVVQDQDGFEYDFYGTDLEDALALQSQKTIHDY